jgi:hypothetical protein
MALPNGTTLADFHHVMTQLDNGPQPFATQYVPVLSFLVRSHDAYSQKATISLAMMGVHHGGILKKSKKNKNKKNKKSKKNY